MWQKFEGVALRMGEKGVTSCLFRNINQLTAAVMQNPNRAICFVRSEWTVVLLGSSSWAASTVRSAVNLGLYDQVSDHIFSVDHESTLGQTTIYVTIYLTKNFQRVHWVILITAEDITPSLHLFHLTQKITWLHWSTKKKGERLL